MKSNTNFNCVGIIGSGFAGLSAACTLAKAGYAVKVFEKNELPGGRARKFEEQGFVFDMGPSWYWMPEVFEQFFNKFGKKASDYFELVRLDPSYSVILGKDNEIKIPASFEELQQIFENIEAGSAQKLDAYLAEAEYKYKVGMAEFVWKPGDSILEFADMRVLSSIFKLDMLTSIAEQVRSNFTHPALRQILEFPVLFLGAKPEKTPALYSLMNYADIKLGTWYPMGGMYKVIEAMVSIAKELGVEFHLSTEVKYIDVPNGKAKSIGTDKGEFLVDYVVAGADYHHVEQTLLPLKSRVYDEKYWQARTMAPSSLLFYLGYSDIKSGLLHHNLFFDKDFGQHAIEIYDKPCWPTDPLFYLCCPSKTDESIAPKGCENIFLLVPIAPGLENDTPEIREKYFDILCQRIMELKGIDLKENLIFKKSYCINDFKDDYNAFKGNAYGLANTLKQTAFLKPKIKSKKVSNLFYAGQLTSPGPGVPPSLISGQVAAGLIIQDKTT